MRKPGKGATTRGTKKGVKGTEGRKGPRNVSGSKGAGSRTKGIAMKPKGKGQYGRDGGRGGRIARMEKSDRPV